MPIGAIIVLNDRVIARGGNVTKKLNDTHCWMVALTSAFEFCRRQVFPHAFLYVTIEPCLMCAGAMYWGKLKKIIWGARK